MSGPATTGRQRGSSASAGACGFSPSPVSSAALPSVSSSLSRSSPATSWSTPPACACWPTSVSRRIWTRRWARIAPSSARQLQLVGGGGASFFLFVMSRCWVLLSSTSGLRQLCTCSPFSCSPCALSLPLPSLLLLLTVLTGWRRRCSRTTITTSAPMCGRSGQRSQNDADTRTGARARESMMSEWNGIP